MRADAAMEISHLVKLRGYEGNACKLQDCVESTEIARQSALPSRSGSQPRLRKPESMTKRVMQRLCSNEIGK